MMIPNKFIKYGQQFTLMSVVGPYHIYRRADQYEIMKPIMIKGELQLPGTSFWGIYGWSCPNEVAVVRMIEKLLEKDKAREEKPQKKGKAKEEEG